MMGAAGVVSTAKWMEKCMRGWRRRSIVLGGGTGGRKEEETLKGRGKWIVGPVT